MGGLGSFLAACEGVEVIETGASGATAAIEGGEDIIGGGSRITSQKQISVPFERAKSFT